MRVRLAAAALAVAAIVGVLSTAVFAPSASAAPAQDQTETTVLLPAPRAPDMIPSPNSGAEPVFSGDRGSGAQYSVLIGMTVAIVAIVGLVYWESRRKKARQTNANGAADQPKPAA